MIINKKYSQGFLLAASAYRRQARERSGLSFSADALEEQYQFETYGGNPPDAKVNGYTCGKWILDAIIKQMYEDHQSGLITKYDLKRGSCGFIRREVSKWPAVTYYPYY